ncbi:hypothetical protein WN944_017650 [Citrus x changshan-huyou]|uniref:Uncharacterized protein n=1 Tax=Citrus x changshan-huyou TaxID=2935761 RepID=A0AAP0MI06_9ROSI
MVRIWKVEFRCPITYEATPTERKVNDSYVNVTIGASLRLLIWDWTIRIWIRFKKPAATTFHVSFPLIKLLGNWPIVLLSLL